MWAKYGQICWKMAKIVVQNPIYLRIESWFWSFYEGMNGITDVLIVWWDSPPAYKNVHVGYPIHTFMKRPKSTFQFNSYNQFCLYNIVKRYTLFEVVYNLFADLLIQERGALIPTDSGNRLPVMNSQSCILIAKLPRFAVAAIYLARVIQIIWLLFNQTTVSGDENGILAMFEFQTKWSEYTQLD